MRRGTSCRLHAEAIDIQSNRSQRNAEPRHHCRCAGAQKPACDSDVHWEAQRRCFPAEARQREGAASTTGAARYSRATRNKASRNIDTVRAAVAPCSAFWGKMCRGISHLSGECLGKQAERWPGRVDFAPCFPPPCSTHCPTWRSTPWPNVVLLSASPSGRDLSPAARYHRGAERTMVEPFFSVPL